MYRSLLCISTSVCMLAHAFAWSKTTIFVKFELLVYWSSCRAWTKFDSSTWHPHNICLSVGRIYLISEGIVNYNSLIYWICCVSSFFCSTKRRVWKKNSLKLQKIPFMKNYGITLIRGNYATSGWQIILCGSLRCHL